MVGKKREKNYNISNKLAYTLVVLALIVGLGIGVFAYGGSSPSVMGHTTGEIAWPACSAGQVLSVSGGNVVCVTPSASDSRFTTDSRGFCYTTSAGVCGTTAQSCSFYKSYVISASCTGMPQATLNTICNSQCPVYPCNGDTTSCSGGTSVSSTVFGECIYSGSTVGCTCSATGAYTQEVQGAAGTYCVVGTHQ